MSRVLLLPAVFCLAFAPAPVPRSKPDTTVKDLKALQGAWYRVSSTVGGNSLDLGGEITVFIDGKRMQFAFNGRPTMEWSFTLDGRPNLSCLDREEVRFPENGRLRGIYRIEGDTLIMHSSRGERPDDFSGKGKKVIVEVFERKKP